MSTLTIERTARRIVWGTWGCAGITMAASAANAALTYGALGDNRVLGLATGIAVDIGLCVALIGDRRLYANGLTSTWGRVLRITTAGMSLVLNTGISVRDGHYFLALMHAFLPVLLVVLTEYGQDVLLQFTALQRARDEADRLTDRTGLVVPTEPIGPVRPIPADTPLFPPSGVGVSTMRATSAPGPVLLHEQSAPHPGAQRFDTVTAHRGGSTSDLNGQVVPLRLPAPERVAPGRLGVPPQVEPVVPPKRPGPAPQDDTPDRSDTDLIRAALALAETTGKTPTAYALKQHLGIGSGRAARIAKHLEAEIDAELMAVATGGHR